MKPSFDNEIVQSSSESFPHKMEASVAEKLRVEAVFYLEAFGRALESGSKRDFPRLHDFAVDNLRGIFDAEHRLEVRFGKRAVDRYVSDNNTYDLPYIYGRGKFEPGSTQELRTHRSTVDQGLIDLGISSHYVGYLYYVRINDLATTMANGGELTLITPTAE